jgi:zinc transport system substrate-binding protein
MKRTALIIIMSIATLLLATATFAKADGPRVVVSIKPIHSLVTGVMHGVAEPSLLIKGGGSPHGYVLRPSEARAMANADLVIWVSHSLESFLEKPLRTLAKKARSLELLDTLSDDLLPFREDDEWGSDDDEHGHGHDHHGHGEDDANPHLWLNPKLAQKIVTHTAQALSEIDPVNKALYEANAAAVSKRLSQLDESLSAKLAPVNERPYIVFHDAYQYFEDAYQLNSVGSLTVDPERKPGAKRILEIRSKIKSSGAVCVFSEPQFEPRLIATLTEGTNVRTGVLDPLGADLPAGVESYFLLMNNLADNLLEGLR